MPHDCGHGHHSHSHDHAHSHGHHHHDASHLSKKALILAISINGLLTIAQIVGGVMANSLALISDALHNASDALALVLALIAIIIGERPADQYRSFGYKRAESIAALVNLTALVLIGVYLAARSIYTLIFPEEVHAPIMIWVAAIALIIDTGTALLLRTHACSSENMRAAFLHNIMDALASLAVILGGVGILYKGWHWLDPALSLVISIYIITHGYHAMKSTIHLLMQGTPHHIDRNKLIVDITELDNVLDMHHVHIWQINEQSIALEAHIVLEDIQKMEDSKAHIKAYLREHYNINHSTLEFENSLVTNHCTN